MVSEMWKHQVRAVTFAQTTPDVGLFYEAGTGKTRCMIEIIRRTFAKENRLKKTLILAPLIVCENWKKEFAEYSKLKPWDILVLTKSGARRGKDFVDAVGVDLAKSKIIITNYESMQMKEFYDLIANWKPEILVCDESQKVKNHESIRAKAVARLADYTAHNYILTGTPILNSAQDVFMQFRILDRGETFGRNYYAFRNEYFYDKNAGFKSKQNYFPDWQPREDAYQRLQDKVRTKALRAVKSECLDLPPFVRQVVHCQMSNDQAKAYREMYADYITWIESKEGEPRAVLAQLAITKAIRLQQIVSGFAKSEDGDIHRLECPRLKVLKELLEDLTPNHKVIIWSHFQENQAMVTELCKELKIGYSEIHGNVPKGQREDIMHAFRTDPKIRVMVANQSAGGVGVNLVEASYAIYFSKGFSLEADLQSEARNFRGGSEIHEKVTRIDLVTPGTIDELITESLSNKQAIGDMILSWKDRLKYAPPL